MDAKLAAFLLACLPAVCAEVKIMKSPAGWQLLRDGQPYFIKGAGGTAHLDRLAVAGGNSVRTWSVSESALDEAERRGLTVMLGLSLARPRHGFDYSNREQVARQLDEVRNTVLKIKDHPALLLWGLGNELELDCSDADRIRVWRAVNQIAELIHKLDGKHPAVPVLAGAGRGKLAEIKEHCPACDAVGINAYGGMFTLPETLVKQGWDGAYIVTEFGPRGHWEAPKTPWGLPIEDSSTEKAEYYLKAYRHAVQDRPQALGSYVFYWSQKQEKTHTWYGLFLPDGAALNPVDAMTFAWTGKWPANRAPRTADLKCQGEGMISENVFAAGTLIHCEVRASDPDGDPLTIKWDVRKDVSNAPQRGGDLEPPTPAIAEFSGAGPITFQLPGAGNYRVFVYAYDGKGSAATQNLPIRVVTQ